MTCRIEKIAVCILQVIIDVIEDGFSIIMPILYPGQG